MCKGSNCTTELFSSVFTQSEALFYSTESWESILNGSVVLNLQSEQNSAQPFGLWLLLAVFQSEVLQTLQPCLQQAPACVCCVMPTPEALSPQHPPVPCQPQAWCVSPPGLLSPCPSDSPCSTADAIRWNCPIHLLLKIIRNTYKCWNK